MALAQVERRNTTSSNGQSPASADIFRFQRENENNERFQELLQAAGLLDEFRSRDVVIPFLSTHVSTGTSIENIKTPGDVRRPDTTSPKGAGRGMPPFILAVAVSAGALILLITPGDYIGEIKGIITASSVYVLYWLSQRSKRKAKEATGQQNLTDELLRLNADKEKRLEEGVRLLRQEEREFAHSQIALSRERGHILARAYMSIWMKSEELIQLLHDNKIEVPRRLLTQETHAQVLGELKEVEERQAGIKAEQENKAK